MPADPDYLDALRELNEPPCWVDARLAKLRMIDQQLDACFDSLANIHIPVKTITEKLQWLEGQKATVLHDTNWIETRPSRKLPSARKVAAYWASHDGVFDVELAHPECFGCGLPRKLWSDFERAHLVDRAVGGLDHEGNLAMLCRVCHGVMPMFEPGEWDDAVAYVHICGTEEWMLRLLD